jgi:prepilin-type N-terminal cleavage/methylation domain-containing protein
MRRCGRDLWLGRDSRTAPKLHLRRTGERGLTMIEMIATIALVSVGVVGIAGGIAATERIATVNQDQSQLEVAMRQLSDWVRDSSCNATPCFTTQPRALPYSHCEQASVMGTDVYNVELKAAVSANVLTPPSNTTFVITKVQESPTGSANGLRNGVGTAPQWTTIDGCPPGVGDWGVQEITLKVSDAARSITRVVWKSLSW